MRSHLFYNNEFQIFKKCYIEIHEMNMIPLQDDKNTQITEHLKTGKFLQVTRSDLGIKQLATTWL